MASITLEKLRHQLKHQGETHPFPGGAGENVIVCNRRVEFIGTLARTELTKTKGFSITKGFGIQQLQELATARGEGSKGNAGKVEENKSEEGNRKRPRRNRKAAASKDYDSMASVSSKR